jgi:hypothetical protein
MSVFTPFVVLWIALALVVIGLLVYRRFVAAGEDDLIHVSDAGDPVLSHQMTIAHKLDQIDKWGKILTTAVVAYGAILAAVYVYQSWMSGV